MGPRIVIEFCQQCRWLMRAGWIAQEILSTFQHDLAEVALVPGTGGVFEIRLNDEVIWSLKSEGRFPEISELKRRIRDKAAPGRHLGHIDRKKA